MRTARFFDEVGRPRRRAMKNGLRHELLHPNRLGIKLGQC